MPNRRHDIDTRTRIEQIECRYRDLAKRVWLAIMGLYVCVLLGGYFLYDNNQTIQASRVQAAFATCQESNDRHDRTIVAFNREFDRAAEDVPASQRKQLDAQRQGNIRLIDVFIPVRKDRNGRSTCRAFAKERARIGQ